MPAHQPYEIMEPARRMPSCGLSAANPQPPGKMLSLGNIIRLAAAAPVADAERRPPTANEERRPCAAAWQRRWLGAMRAACDGSARNCSTHPCQHNSLI